MPKDLLEFITAGFRPRSAGPEFHGGKHSLPRKILLQTATGGPHPPGDFSFVPTKEKQKNSAKGSSSW